jgi:hypothetical protein
MEWVSTVFWWLWIAVGIAIVVWFIRYVVSVLRGDYRHASGAKRIWWVPGAGTHGGEGGQVPPIVVDYDDD